MIVLIIFTILSPFLVAAFTKSIPLAIAMNFVNVHTMVMLNEVARDVEDPFHYDPNELPLPQIQYRMNERLLSVAKTTRPVAFTDVADLCGPSNIPNVKPVRTHPIHENVIVPGRCQPLCSLSVPYDKRIVPDALIL
jgi:hypothetical protein